MELFDLYTRDRIRTGRTMVRGDKVPEGLYRLVVHVCIFDPEGRMLIQQRQPFKKGWSNMWDITVGGCAVAGDTSQDADLSSLHLQYEEVQTVRWAEKEEILRMIDDGQFISYEKSLIELLFFFRNHSGTHTKGDPTRK